MELLGITDSMNSCDCCGKTDLKCTVAFRQSDGNIVYYGRICAQHWYGKSQKDINKEIKSIKDQAKTEANNMLRADPVFLEFRAVLQKLDEDRPEYKIRRQILEPYDVKVIARRKEIVSITASKYMLKPDDIVMMW